VQLVYCLPSDPEVTRNRGEGFIMNNRCEAPELVITEIGPVSGLTLGLAFTSPQTESSPPPYQYHCAPFAVRRAAPKRSIRLTTSDSGSRMRKRDPLADAARWFIELITAADINRLWPQFEAWLHEDPSNRSAYEEMERMWSEVCSAGVICALKGVRDPSVVLH
jgi:hypothetical protein